MREELSPTEAEGEQTPSLAATIVATAPVIILVLDLAGSVQLLNPQFTAITGRQTSEAIGQDWFSFVVPERDREGARRKFQDALRGATSGSSSHPITTSAGAQREIEWLDQIQRGDDGRVTGLLRIGRDVTERMLAEATLRVRDDVLRTVFEGAPLVIFALDREGRFRLVEGQGLSPTGITPGHLLGTSAYEMAGRVSEGETNLRRALAGETVRCRAVIGSTCFDATYLPRFDAAGDVVGVVGAAFAITEQVQADETMRLTRDQLDATLAALPDLLFEVDEAGRVLGYHARADELLAVPPEDFLGRTFHDVLPAEAADACVEAIVAASLDGRAVGRAYRLDMPSGERWYEPSVGRRAVLPGETTRLVLLARDISDRVLSARRLAESEQLFRTLAEVAPVGIYRITDGRCSYVNDRLCEIMGLSRSEATSGGWAASLHPADLVTAREDWNRAFTQDRPFVAEYRCVHPDGSVRWILSQACRNRTPNGGAGDYVGTVTDITERKNAEQSRLLQQEQLEATLQAIPDLLFEIDRNGRYVAVRAQCTDGPSAPGEELVGRNIRDVLPADAVTVVQRAIDEAAADSVSFGGTFSLDLPQGRQWFELSSSRKPGAHGCEATYVVLARDITARKQAEDATERALAEKEVLLRELQHRVKNNLQLISSLLQLQGDKLEDSAARALFEESRARVQTIARCHDLLSQSADLSQVDFSVYLRTVAEELVGSHTRAGPPLAISVKAPEALIDIQVALPCGLIVNELLTNILKYAFPDGRQGSIRVVLDRCDKRHWALSVADDGIGLPEALVPHVAQSLGFKLIHILATQIGGRIQVDCTRGTRFELIFPV